MLISYQHLYCLKENLCTCFFSFPFLLRIKDLWFHKGEIILILKLTFANCLCKSFNNVTFKNLLTLYILRK